MPEKFDPNDFSNMRYPPGFFENKTADELGISEEHRQFLIEREKRINEWRTPVSNFSG